MGSMIYYALMAAGIAGVALAWRIAVLSDRRARAENEAFRRHLMVVIQQRRERR